MDQAAATSLVNNTFEASGAFLVKYAQRRVHSPAMAEDIVQEAFLALYRDLRLGKNIQDAKHWVFGAVRNQIFKHARDRRRHGEDLVPTDQLDLIAADPFSEYTAEETPIALAVLTPREEEVILLRLQSLKYREIAALLGIGTKSVCTLLARAIRKLRDVSGADATPPERAATKKRGVSSAALQR